MAGGRWHTKPLLMRTAWSTLGRARLARREQLDSVKPDDKRRERRASSPYARVRGNSSRSRAGRMRGEVDGGLDCDTRVVGSRVNFHVDLMLPASTPLGTVGSGTGTILPQSKGRHRPCFSSCTFFRRPAGRRAAQHLRPATTFTVHSHAPDRHVGGEGEWWGARRGGEVFRLHPPS